MGGMYYDATGNRGAHGKSAEKGRPQMLAALSWVLRAGSLARKVKDIRGPLVTGTSLAERQPHCREAMREGSRGPSSGPRNTKRIGDVRWMRERARRLEAPMSSGGWVW
jgi:hypothetical protein